MKNKIIKAVQAFEMLKENKTDEEILKICSPSTLRKVKTAFNKKKKRGEELILDKYPQKSKKRNYKTEKKVTIQENVAEKIIDSNSSDLRTLEDLIEYSKIDTKEFECTNFISNVYGSKNNPSIQCKGVFKKRTESPLTIKEQAQIFKEFVSNYKPKHIKKTYHYGKNEKYAAVLPIADLHFGSRSVADETGDENNLEITKKLLIDSMLFHRDHIMKYHIDKIIIPILGDFFNVDNTFSTTTKGTYQEEYTSLKQTFRKGCELIIEIIDSFSAFGKVYVPICRGNHDETGSFYLQCFLEAFYKDSNVHIEKSDMQRKYVKYGNTCLGFGHGDTRANADYLSIMLSEFNAFDSKYREFIVGHLHHTKTEEKPGIKVRRVGSLCASDTWHKKMGYNSMRSSEGYILSKDHGIICNTTFYV